METAIHGLHRLVLQGDVVVELQSLLFAAKGGPVEYHGKLVYYSFPIFVAASQLIGVEILSCNLPYKQHVKLSVDRGNGYIKLNNTDKQRRGFTHIWVDVPPEPNSHLGVTPSVLQESCW